MSKKLFLISTLILLATKPQQQQAEPIEEPSLPSLAHLNNFFKIQPRDYQTIYYAAPEADDQLADKDFNEYVFKRNKLNRKFRGDLGKRLKSSFRGDLGK